jgi:hypothetical protein
MQARVAKLRREYELLAVELRPKWLAAIEREWGKIDKAQRHRAEELAVGFGRQRELRAVWRYVDAIEHGENAEHVLRKALGPGGNPQRISATSWSPLMLDRPTWSSNT